MTKTDHVASFHDSDDDSPPSPPASERKRSAGEPRPSSGSDPPRKSRKSSRKSRHESRLLEDPFSYWRRKRWPMWQNFAENTTFHGINHMTNQKGPFFWYYVVVFVILLTMFTGHNVVMLLTYLSTPVSTEISVRVELFRYPDVTFCPLSPLSTAQVERLPTLKQDIESATQFWQQHNLSLDNDHLGLADRVKYSLFSRYGHFWPEGHSGLSLQRLIQCQVQDRPCYDAMWRSAHPMFHGCLTLRSPARQIALLPGANNGIRVAFYRNSSYKPALLSSLLEVPVMSGEDGVLVVLHEPDTFPMGELTRLPNVFTIRYGQRARVQVSSVKHHAQPRPTRHCAMEESRMNFYRPGPYEALLSRSKPISPQDDFKATKASCVAMRLQQITWKRCGCFSPFAHLPEGSEAATATGPENCYEQLWRQSADKARVHQTLKCLHRLAVLDEEKLLQEFKMRHGKLCTKSCSQHVFSVESLIVKTLDEPISAQHLHTYRQVLEHQKVPNLDSSVDGPAIDLNEDLPSHSVLLLDINTEESYHDNITESLQYPLHVLLSEIGGTTSLYLGFTIYTLFEFGDLALRCAYYGYFMLLAFWRRSKGNAPAETDESDQKSAEEHTKDVEENQEEITDDVEI